MKISKLFLSLVIALTAVSSAGAADTTFKAGNGVVFGTKNVYKYELYAYGGGFVKTSYTGGDSTAFVDPGNLGNRILQALPQLVNLSGTNTYIDSNALTSSYCQNGKTILFFQGVGASLDHDDNCVTFGQLQAHAK